MSANGKIFAEEFSPIGSIKPSDKVLVEDATDKVVKYGLFGQLTAINGYAYRNSIAELPLPPSQPNIAYVVGREFYVYVGEGGDTAGGAYQSIEFGVGGLSIEELQSYLDANGYITEGDLPEGAGATQEWVTQQIQAAIDALVGDAPETLDTLKEIADMLGDNTDDIKGLISAMENKADKATTLAGYGITDAYTKSQVNTFLASKSGKYNNLAGYGITDAYTITQIDNIVSELNTEIGKKWTQNNDDIAKWNAAYSWGNHASAGYVTETELLEKEYASVAYVVAGYARNTRKISAGTGLTGGGDLQADRTLALATVGTAGTYTKVTTDAYGRVTSGTTLSASDIPNLDWAKITSGKPTTISGYGITDAYTKTQIDTELAKYVTLATAQDISARHNFTDGLQIGGLPITKSADGIIYLDANLVVSGAITIFGEGSTTFPTIWANIPFNEDQMSWDGSQWNVTVGGTGSVDEATVNTLIREYLGKYSYAQISDISSALAGYATESWVRSNYLSQTGGTVNGSITADSFIGNLTGNADSATYLLSNSVNEQNMDLVKATGAYFGYSMTNAAINDTISSFLNLQYSSDWGFQLQSAIERKRVFFRNWRNSGGVMTDWVEFITTENIASHALPITGGTINGSIEASSFIGDLTGNADSANYLTVNALGGQGNLNDHKRSGIYSFYSATNAPTSNIATMLVLNYSNDWGSQVYFGAGNSNVFYRKWQNAGGIFQDAWREFAFLDSDNFTPASGTMTVNGSITANGKITNIVDSAKYTNGVFFSCPTAVAGDTVNVTFGKANSSYNLGYIGHFHTGDDSIENCITFGGHSADHLMRIFYTGNVAIGGTTASEKLHVYGRIYSSEVVSSTQWVSDTAQLMANCYGTSYKVGIAATSDGYAVVQGGNYGIGAIPLLLNPSGGNVAIGGTTADAKLHVGGDVFAEGVYKSAQDYIMLRANAGTNSQAVMYFTEAESYIEAPNGSPFFIGWRGGSALLSFDASKNATINGDLLTTGAITMFSQLSMKNVIDYDGLSLAQLEQIKPARFTWKDGRDYRIHVGGIADDVMQVLPEVVHRTSDDKLTMDYASAGFFVAASLIKPVIDHERRIADLERENEQLKQQLEQLKAA